MSFTINSATERLLLDYYISRAEGIYYVYDKCLGKLPETFASKETSHYLAAVEALADYPQAKEKLSFVANWLISNKNECGSWDLGSSVKDGVYFPLADSLIGEEWDDDESYFVVDELKRRQEA